MKHLTLCLLTAMLLLPSVAFGQYRAEFDGEWNEITTDGVAACDVVFAQTAYNTKHFLVGPTRRTIVTHFSSTEPGFFSGRHFASNYGYNNDFLYRETREYQGTSYAIEIYGVVTLDFVLMDAKVSALGTDGQAVCETSGSFSGFN